MTRGTAGVPVRSGAARDELAETEGDCNVSGRTQGGSSKSPRRGWTSRCRRGGRRWEPAVGQEMDGGDGEDGVPTGEQCARLAERLAAVWGGWEWRRLS